MTPSDRLASPSGCPFVGPQKPRRAPWWRRLRHRSPLLRYLFPPAAQVGSRWVGPHDEVIVTRTSDRCVWILSETHGAGVCDRRTFAGMYRRKT